MGPGEGFQEGQGEKAPSGMKPGGSQRFQFLGGQIPEPVSGRDWRGQDGIRDQCGHTERVSHTPENCFLAGRAAVWKVDGAGMVMGEAGRPSKGNRAVNADTGCWKAENSVKRSGHLGTASPGYWALSLTSALTRVRFVDTLQGPSGCPWVPAIMGTSVLHMAS